MHAETSTALIRAIHRSIWAFIVLVFSVIVYLIVDGVFLNFAQKAGDLPSIPIIWPGGPAWPPEIAIPLFFLGSLLGELAITVLIAIPLKRIVGLSVLVVTALVYAPLLVFGMVQLVNGLAELPGNYDHYRELAAAIPKVATPVLFLRWYKPASCSQSST